MATESPHGRPLVVAGAVVLTTWVALTFLVEVPLRWTISVVKAAELLQMASMMVALAIAAIGVARWRLSGDAPALWVGVASGLYGAVRLGFSGLLPVVVETSAVATSASWARPAALVVVLAMLVRAVAMTPVHGGLGPARLTFVGLLAIAGLGALFPLAPGLAFLVDGVDPERMRDVGAVDGLGLVAPAAAVIGLVYLVQGARRQRWLFVWMGVFLVTLALARLTRVLGPPPLVAGLLGSEVLRLLGIGLGMYGATREIIYTYRDASIRLALSEHSVQTAEERIRLGQQVAEERAHEARSALAAIEGATRTLEHYRDRLPAETQQALSTAIGGEIRRLQRLVTPHEPEEDVVPFSLAEMLAPVVATERARGTEVTVAVPGDLDALGRASSTEQVVQTLFENARRYAPGPLTIRGEREREWVVLRIEDRGPGVPPEQREVIFRRGVRGDTDVPGTGLGLYVATQLMRNQGGEIWVDGRPGGGASFAVALPTTATRGNPDTAADDAEDAHQPP